MKWDVYYINSLVLTLQRRETKKGIVWDHIYDELDDIYSAEQAIEQIDKNLDKKEITWGQKNQWKAVRVE
ncbi:MAG: hypothetical protein DRP08_02275 [Candidatus Aenigmatarchaeota archaeon]|nr:MAG: hypothetical protein DRP08_02275 [Candidatus Aenigmarchaeota archaeon]